jgi:hypothetical protein
LSNIHDLLTIASDGDIVVSAHDDLNRARGRLIRRRRARLKAVTGSIGALAVVAAVGVAVGSSDKSVDSPPPSSSVQAGAIHLVSAHLDAGSFSFGKVPDSWTVQRATTSSVVMIPPGHPYGLKVPASTTGLTDGKVRPTAPPHLNSFEGKLLISFDQYPLDGQTATIGGRAYQINSDDRYTIISVETLPGQPDGVVRVQFPTQTGWSQATLREFLDSVTVNDSAKPSV